MPAAFQSSPGPKAGCYDAVDGAAAPFRGVSILTRPEGRVLRGDDANGVVMGGVSILTRPEGRVLLPSSRRSPGGRTVSILTRPEGRVLRMLPLTGSCATSGFNPHPARRPGATGGGPRMPCPPASFQSSPGPKAGCYATMLHAALELGMFQSSPGPKAGCYFRRGSWRQSARRGFNPHPARRPGATGGRRGFGFAGPVSILTRPEGRVLLSPPTVPTDCPPFQSSPGPKAGCYQRR